jgi:hypothetical protein
MYVPHRSIPTLLSSGRGALGGCGRTSSKPDATLAVSSDFLGLVYDQVFSAAPVWKARIVATQRQAGVELLRQEFAWAQIEPHPGVFDFAPYDAFMDATAGAGIQVLAVVDAPPAWAATKPPAASGCRRSPSSPRGTWRRLVLARTPQAQGSADPLLGDLERTQIRDLLGRPPERRCLRRDVPSRVPRDSRGRSARGHRHRRRR